MKCPKCSSEMEHERTIEPNSARDRWESWTCKCGYKFAHQAQLPPERLEKTRRSFHKAIHGCG